MREISTPYVVQPLDLHMQHSGAEEVRLRIHTSFVKADSNDFLLFPLVRILH